MNVKPHHGKFHPNVQCSMNRFKRFYVKMNVINSRHLSSHEWSCSSGLVNYAKYVFISSTLVRIVSSYSLTKAKSVFSDSVNFLECWFQSLQATKRLTEGGDVCSYVNSFPFLIIWDSAVESLRWLSRDSITTNVFPFYWRLVILALIT